jgi:hypothetical protein
MVNNDECQHIGVFDGQNLMAFTMRTSQMLPSKTTYQEADLI